MIELKFLDGSIVEYEEGVLVIEVAKTISPTLAKNSVAAYLDGELYDLNRPIYKSGDFKLITKDEAAALDVLNHSTAHLLAHALKNLYPHVKFGIGPAIKHGFYYDIDLGDEVITQDMLETIEKEMKKIVKSGYKMERKELSKEQALAFFSDDEYKLELINELADNEVISIYTQGDFSDLCRGGHIGFVSNIKHFKLLNVSGAYWRGNSDNKQLQRIYGTAWFSKDDLDNYLVMIEEAKKRDHRKLGKELELFMFSDYGPGFPFFLPNGMIFREQLEKYWYEVHKRYGYQMIKTPVMLDKSLWEKSGHWFNFRENMYVSEVEKHEYAIKPMNCPGALLIYNSTLHSYKSFPLRVAELGLVHRHESSGSLHGLFRVRSFTQDDAHIFITEEQIASELLNVIDLYKEVYAQFGLDFYIELSTRPEKYIGEIATWDMAEAILANVCKDSGIKYYLNPADGAFYGPKLDFQIEDSIGRVWQCGTIQLDFNLPARFEATYIASDGTKKQPIMLHRTCFGAIERFMGILIEHYAGVFPVWLAPRQVDIILVNEQLHLDYGTKLHEQLINEGLRANIDLRDEKLSYKIRQSQMSKVPYQVVIGDQEMQENLVTYRKYGSKEQTTVSTQEFIAMLVDLRDNRS